MKYYPNIIQSFGISGILILAFVLFSPVCIILRKFIGNEAAFFIYYILTAVVTFFIINKIRKKNIGNFTFNKSLDNRRLLLFVFFGTIFLYAGFISPISALIPMSDAHIEAFLNRGGQIGMFSLLQLIVVAPFFEEIIFRGIILDGLLKKYSPTKSILISSLVFGLTHLNPTQFVFCLIIGCFSGWIYYKTKSLFLPILIHSIANTTSVLMQFFLISDSMRESILIGMYGGVANLSIVIACSAIGVIICIYFLIKEFGKMNAGMVKIRNMLR